MAIEHNDFVAQTTNRQTVLNILRARHREPMHFTSLGTIGGKVQSQGQLAWNTAFNGNGGSLAQTDSTVTATGATGAVNTVTTTDSVVDTLSRGATNITPSAFINVNTGTDFQVIPNATEEFYRGILGSMTSGVVIHYLRQGFPPDLLTHLVVGRIDVYARISETGRKPRLVLLDSISNAPDEDADIAQFMAAVRCRQLGYSVSPIAASHMPVPVSSLSGISADVLTRLRAVRARDGTVSYEIVTPARNEFGLTLARPPGADCSNLQAQLVRWLNERAAAEEIRLRTGFSLFNVDAQAARLNPDLRPYSAQARVEQSSDAQLAISEEISVAGGPSFTGPNFFTPLLPEGTQGDLVIEVTLRSVEGILYYLGEYVRRDNPRPLLRHENCPSGGYCLPILRIRPASEITSSQRFIDVAYRGNLYAVPLAGPILNAESGRSSQVISLVQQLLNLHRSSRDLPTTPLIRIQN
jgi:hypothetical protein